MSGDQERDAPYQHPITLDNLLNAYGISPALKDAVKQMEAKYNELIYAVGKKFTGETRHETALRYIRQSEAVIDSPQKEVKQ